METRTEIDERIARLQARLAESGSQAVLFLVPSDIFYLWKNTPVLLDFVGVSDGYLVDMTRMFIVGELNEKLNRALKVSLETQETVRKAMGSCAICEEIYQQASAMAVEPKFVFPGKPSNRYREHLRLYRCGR